MRHQTEPNQTKREGQDAFKWVQQSVPSSVKIAIIKLKSPFCPTIYTELEGEALVSYLSPKEFSCMLNSLVQDLNRLPDVGNSASYNDRYVKWFDFMASYTKKFSFFSVFFFFFFFSDLNCLWEKRIGLTEILK